MSCAFFKTILLEEQSFDLHSGIVHTGIFHSLCLVTRGEFEDSGYQLVNASLKNVYECLQDF